MAEIDMVGGSNFAMSHGSSESTVQKGGPGEIEMLGGSDLHLKHGPIGSEQAGKGNSGIDMAGEQGLLSHSVVTPYGSMFPTDKGE